MNQQEPNSRETAERPGELAISEETFQQHLHGKRLICEVGFEEKQIQELQDALKQLEFTAWDSFPAIAAVTTVGVGVYRYRSGSYWDHWPWLRKPNDTTRWGERFEAFLECHPSLETFDFLIHEERAHRFLARILAHGGVPLSCIDELFELIARFGSPGESGEELLEYLRGRIPRLGMHAVPLRRFIEYGGEVAEDLVGRLVALRDAHETSGAGFGLPPRIVESFRVWQQAHHEMMSSDRSRFPSPTVHLDPSTYSLKIQLPQCDGHPDAGKSWCFADIRYPSNRTTSVILREPRESWEVANGERRYVFRGITEASSALFFDARTGRLIREPEKRRLPERVWAILREGTEISVEPQDEESFRPWPGFRMVSLDLEGTQNLKSGDRLLEVRRPFFHGDLEPLSFVRSREGLPVLSRPPRLDWPGKANMSVERDRKSQGSIDLEARELPELLTDAAEYRLLLRGPLGDSQSSHFVLVPGLQVEARPSVMLPCTSSTDWRVTIPEGEVLVDGESRTFMRSSKPNLSMEIRVRGRQLLFTLAVPKLEWMLNASQDVQEDLERQWSSQGLSASISQLRDELFPHLIIRLPRVALTEAVEIALVNHERDERLTAHPVTVQRDRVWRFDLRQARAWCEASGDVETLDIVMHDDEKDLYRGKIFEIRPEWDLHEGTFKVSWKKDESGQEISWRWDESGPCSEGRWLTLESCWQPWAEPIVAYQLQRDERGQPPLQLPLPKLPPGRYRAKAIHAPWGLGDVTSATPVAEEDVDVAKEIWPVVFSIEQEPSDFRLYLEALAAHWRKPELVRFGPVAPANLTPDDVCAFLSFLFDINRRWGPLLPPNWSEPLNIFWKNWRAMLKAVATLGEMHELWLRVLPDHSVRAISYLGGGDRTLLREVVLNYRSLANRVASGGDRSSDVLRIWRREFGRNRVPRLGDLVFLCERFQVVGDDAAYETRAEYEILKRGHERMLGNYRRSEW